MALPKEFTDYLADISREAADNSAATPEAQPEVAVETLETPEQPAGDEVAAEPELVEGDDNSAPEDVTPEVSAVATPSPQSSANEQIVEVAKAYGFSAEDAAEFETMEDFNRALSLVNKVALRVGSRMTAPPPRADAQVPAQQQAPQTQQQPPAQAPAPVPEVPEKSPLDIINEGLQKITSSGDYDDNIVAILKATGDAVKATAERNKALESGLQAVTGHLRQNHEMQRQAQIARDIEDFEKSVEKLGHADLFGSGENRTPEEIENLAKLYHSMNVVRTGLNAVGVRTKIDPQIVKQAFGAAFTGVIQKKAAVQKTSAIQNQSRQRMGTGQRASLPAKQVPYTGPEDGASLVKHPAIREIFERTGMQT
jgi:hypothetical protein